MVAALGSCISLVPDALDGEDGPTKTLEFERAENLERQRFADLDESDGGGGRSGPDAGGRSTLTEFILVSSDSYVPGDAEFTAFLVDAAAGIAVAADELVVGGLTEYQTQVSEDGTTLLISIQNIGIRRGRGVGIVVQNNRFQPQVITSVERIVRQCAGAHEKRRGQFEIDAVDDVGFLDG